MTAGYNLKFRVWRMAFANDDVIGGAIASGTVAYSNIEGRIQAVEPDQVFLQQGLETLRTFKAVVRPASMAIYERDEIEVIKPPSHPLYGRRLRVQGVTLGNFHPQDDRGYLILNLTRSERAHGNQ